ncbi:MAG: c-type cytochrome [Opitutales bacterium]
MSQPKKEDSRIAPAPNAEDAGTKQIEAGRYGDIQMQALHTQLAREKEEPTEGFSPIPIFLLFIFGALMFWGGLHMVSSAGEFRADIFDPNKVIADEGGSDLPDYSSPEWLLARGETLYNQNCVTCHQADGNGVAGNFPPLNGSEWVGGDPARITKIVLNGLAGPIEVKGNEYNAAMVGYDFWRDRDIAAAVSYVRNSWENEHPLITPDEVKAIRDSLGGRTSQWSGPELLELYPLD